MLSAIVDELGHEWKDNGLTWNKKFEEDSDENGKDFDDEHSPVRPS